MRRIFCCALATIAIVAVCRASAQQADAAPTHATSHHLTWTYDPLHGTMQAKVPPPVVYEGQPEAAPAATTPPATTTYSGTIAIDFTISLVSSVPANSSLICSAGAGIEYTVTEKVSSDFTAEYIYIIEASQSVDATVSGTTATCKFSIPYSWTLPKSGGDTTVSVQGISGSAGVSELVVDTTLPRTDLLRTARSNAVNLNGPTTLPPNGTTISLTASTVL
jgi:hypothetical protein